MIYLFSKLFLFLSFIGLEGQDTSQFGKSYFEENRGQINYLDLKPASEVKFIFKQGNLKIFLLIDGLAYQLEKFEQDTTCQLPLPIPIGTGSFSTYRMDMLLIGANPNPEILTEGKSDDYINYYQPDLIQTHKYQKIIYKNIYPGIDWVIYSKSKDESQKPKANKNYQLLTTDSYRDYSFKYDFIIHPGADPSQIKLKYSYAEQIFLDQLGNLILRNRLGDIRENAPIANQLTKNIPIHFKLQDSILSFCILNYNKEQILTIDPKLEWSTYYGGTGNEEITSSQVDNSANLYVSGYTNSTNNISFNGFQTNVQGPFSLFLVKFNEYGKRLWGTYYGQDVISSSGAIDRKNNFILTGYTQNSTTNMAHNGHQNTHGGAMDGLIVKFDSAGYRVWASYYGGSGNDFTGKCTIDTANNLYIDGYTLSYSGIAQNGYQDTFYTKYNGSGQLQPNQFLAKLNENGARIWGTYFGLINNSSNSNNSLFIDNNYLYHARQYSDTHLLFTVNTGELYGIRFFISKFNLNGTRVFSVPKPMSFLSFNLIRIYKHDTFFYVLLRITSSLMPVLSTGFKTTATGSSDYMIMKLDMNLNTVWQSYCGGNLTEDFRAALVFDKFDNMYFGGMTNSTSGIYNRGLDSTLSGGLDVFVTKISKVGNIIWSSYIGGNSYETIEDLKLDLFNNLYLCGITRSATDVAYNGHQNVYGGGFQDGFLMKISCNQNDTIRDTICLGDSLQYRNKYYSKEGFYTDSLLTWDICDSFITLHLTVLRKDTTYLYDTICSGTNYVWNGGNRTMSGVYRDTLINNLGCDSFLILNLHIKRTDTMQVYDTSCANLPKTFNGQNLTLAGVYQDTLKNIVGCDSHIFYHFIPRPIYEIPLSRAVCAGDSSLFGGRYYKQGGVYFDTLKTIRSCDSVLKLTLTINQLDTSRQTQSICRGKSYNFYSQVLTSQGTYSHKLTNLNGCNSLILLTLSVIDSSTYSLSRMLCSGQSFSFNNQTLTQAGVYRDTFMNYLGCDSFVTLNLSFGLVLYDTLSQTVCAGQVFRGYSSPGTYKETYKSILGCDSILTIYLKHLPTTEYKTVSHSKCGAFRYGSRIYTQNDSFTETIKNYLNCDSIVTKHLVSITEPQPKFLADKTIEFCEEMIHKGQRKTTSFFSQDTVKSLEFPYCDSLYQPYYYRRENRPVLTAISKQIDTVIKGETTNIQVSGAQNYRWTTGEQSPSIRPQITEDKIFEVTAWNLADCEEKMQFNIYAIDQLLIDFPTAFSPNGDGLNDYFTPNLSGNISIDYFQIYNRWGEKVYEYSPFSKGWDGNYLGQPAANGLYTYTLRYSYLGRSFTKSGEVMVVR